MSFTPHLRPRRRVLLALEGDKLSRELQLAALRICIRLSAPLDILMTQAPGQQPPLPAALMLHLEHSGLDYRFARVIGALSEEILRYLARGRVPCTVIVTRRGLLSAVCVTALEQGQHQLIDLSAPEQDTRPGPSTWPLIPQSTSV